MSNVSAKSILTRYVREVERTDVLGSDLNPVLMGLYGEVGGLMSAAKKHVREGSAYPGYRRTAEEEFGDTLWYLASICRRVDIQLSSLVSARALALSQIAPQRGLAELDEALFELGRAAADLLATSASKENTEALLKDFMHAYLATLGAAGLDLACVAKANVQKVQSAFLKPAMANLPVFDKRFGEDERIPERFKIQFSQRRNGKTYMRWNGVFIGDPLTDNIADPDGYRFHDVFHLSHAAILHWSPVFRALIKHKRKSVPAYDEEQDGGRAIVVEEGLTAWIFSRAKELDFFRGQRRVSLSILKTVGEFVEGFEVEAVPLKLWEKAILDGYSAFRSVRDAGGGWIVCDRAARSVKFKPL